MSTPVCLANAVADALGVDDIALPMTPARLMALIEPEEPAPAAPPLAPPAAGKGLSGSGVLSVPAPPEEIWSMLLDPKALAALLPGCEALERTGENAYHARLRIGIGPVRGRYEAKVRLFDLEPPRALRLRGEGIGALGSASGEGAIALAPEGTGTRVSYRYSAAIAGKVAAVGGRMLDGAARLLIDQFFERLIARSGGAAPVPLWRRLLRLLRLAR